MDVPMPANSGTRAASWRAWVDQRRRPAIISAFAAAALLGVLIGVLTAPHATTKPNTTAVAVAQARSPVLPASSWAASRSLGKAHNVTLDQSTSPVVRTALAWAAADYALAKAGRPTWSQVYNAEGSPAAGTSAARAAAGKAALTDQSITIPLGLLYGAIEGADASTDQFWVVGFADSASGAVTVDRLHVWERVGTGPWTVVASGPGACTRIPAAMSTVWGASPAPCHAS
jgi:hypothetical protein